MGKYKIIPKTNKSFPNAKAKIASAFGKQIENKWSKFKINSTSSNIRVPAVKLSGERWGNGLDEMYPTRLLKSNPSKFSEASLKPLFMERIRTSSLIWKTKASKLGGHPGALKSHDGPSTKGMIVTEHGTRDRLREQAILVEGKNSSNALIKSKLGTIKYMISPAEELHTNDTLAGLKKQKSSIYSSDKDIGDLIEPANLEKLSQKQQYIRESLKWDTAKLMIEQGMEELVPPEYKKFLKKGGTPEQARDNFQSKISSGKIKAYNQTSTSQTDDLSRSLEQMKKSQQRSLSPARRYFA